jgi:hypothetical protein
MNRTGARPDKLSNPTSLRPFSQIEQPINRPSRDAKVSPKEPGARIGRDRAYADRFARRLANFGPRACATSARR